MRIGIVTQPLKANYGGILQNFALQQVLKNMGHEPITIDYVLEISRVRYCVSTLKTIILKIMGRKREFINFPRFYIRHKCVDVFIQKHVSVTRRVSKYHKKLIDEYHLDAIIVGSDQVWRPLYSPFIHNMFLDFTSGMAIRRLAYAASFGVDNMEYSDKQLKRCSKLLKEFDGLSVREASGVSLCRDYFGVDALHVLDPTLLNDKEIYEKLCQNVPKNSSKFLASYVLDISEEKKIYIESIAKQLELEINYFTADEGFSLTIEEWLAMFRDASFIITDSFHGTIFSIIFNKPFFSLTNEVRGNSRFESLLSMLGLERRLNASFESVGDNDIDWVKVRESICELKSKAFNFLRENLD